MLHEEAFSGYRLSMLTLLVGMFLGLALGLGLSWLVARRGERDLRAAYERETELKVELDQKRDAVSELRERIAALTTELENERRSSVEKLRVVESAREELAQAFRSASAEALKNNSEAFLVHAE